jgi:PEGA domain
MICALRRLRLIALVLPLFFSTVVRAGSSPGIVMFWPNQDKPTIKVTFGTFRQVASYAGKLTLVADVMIENVSGQPIPRASFSVHLMDKDKVRIGNGLLVFDDLSAGEATKVLFQCETVGVPSGIGLAANRDAQGVPNATKVIPLKIISVPAGAKLKVDGQEQGITPVLANLTVGTHTLELSKDDFATATSPIDVKPDEMEGGSITIELAGLSQDTMELRDGTVLTGDAVSLSLTELIFRVDGKDMKYDRNQIKKITLVERIVTKQAPVVQPASGKGK